MRGSKVLHYIAGPRTYSWQAAVWLFAISVYAGFRLNVEPDDSNRVLLLSVMLGVAAITIATYATLAAGYTFIKNFTLRITYAFVGFFIVIVVRAKVGDVLLMEWGISQESKLTRRFEQTFVIGIISLVGLAMLMNVIYFRKQKMQLLQDKLQTEINLFNEAFANLADQRIYTIHEMSIESATAQELVVEIDEVLAPEHPARSALAALSADINVIANMLSQARQMTPVAIHSETSIPEVSWIQRHFPVPNRFIKKLDLAIVEISISRQNIDQMYKNENRLWKQTFISDISRSPTAGTILLRQIFENTKSESVTEQMTSVAQIWKSVVEDALSYAANSSRLRTSGRLEP